MAQYKAPLRDLRFVLHEVMGAEQLATLPGYEEASADVIDAILEEGARFVENELFPLNLSGDKEGCHYRDGVVRTPEGLKAAYAKFVEGGWGALSAKPEFGGQGLPKTLKFVMEELICSANVSFSLYPGLTFGAVSAIEAHASDDLRSAYLPKMVSGEWTGTMCLTEPHAGTDLGLIRTKAEPVGDGSYRITGTKIFITAGEHDLAGNIVHLVLAKLPDAPAGVKGISMFLVPKFMPDAAGNPGARNALRCGSIEHKMGLKASATCVMNFDGAVGYLVGAPHQGLRCMFTMMNAERLIVGIQGLGIAETAYQSAAAYAKERIQSRSLDAAKQDAARPADPIIVHPDVRRMLLSMRATTEAARALSVFVGMQIDVAARHPDAEIRAEADDLVALLTPVVKAYFTDHGFEAANTGMQVYGGHGYIHDHGMEQLARDARICMIYEGTNGIQAMDLVGRKLPMGGGRLFETFVKPIAGFLAEHGDDAALKEFVGPLAKSLDRLRQTTAWVAKQSGEHPLEAGAAAADYLKLFGLTALAFMWARMAKVATERLAETGDVFYATKLEVGRFFMSRVLPQQAALVQTIQAGSQPIMTLDAANF